MPSDEGLKYEGRSQNRTNILVLRTYVAAHIFRKAGRTNWGREIKIVLTVGQDMLRVV